MTPTRESLYDDEEDTMFLEVPQEFEPAYYVQMKPYLKLSNEGLKREFEEFGKKSGTPGSPFCYRKNVVNALKCIAGSILEIGPAHAPDFIGDNVRYLDIVRKEELQKLYPEMPEANGGTPEIHYLHTDLAAGNIQERFDLVYSAHNFEHQVNPIMHINSVAEILNPGGIFVSVIPDKNYTYDYYRPLSTLTDILCCGADQTVHTLKTALESQLTTHNDPIQHWLGYHGNSEFKDGKILEKYRNYKYDSNEFISHHVTVFESDSFKKIFTTLSQGRIINMKLIRCYNTPFLKHEFVAIFAKRS